MVNHTIFPLRASEKLQLLNDVANRRCSRANGTRTVRATQRAHSAHNHFGLLTGKRLDSVLHRNELPSPNEHLPFLREVERHDGDLFSIDVLPNVEFRPIRQRKDTHALSCFDATVEEVPKLRPLILGVPLSQ